VLLAGLWFVLGASVLALSHHLDRPVQLCLFKRVTGFPCPTCGFTRGMFALLRGHPIEAWLYNPLLFSLLTVLGIGVMARVFFEKGLEVRLAGRERIACWSIGCVLFVANWLYVIRYVG
jgi:hypothetical protein